MKKRLVLVLFLTCLFIFYGCSSTKTLQDTAPDKDVQLTAEEKLADFEYMYKILNENYPFFEVNKRVHGIDWLGNREKYLELVKLTTSDDEFFDTLRNILADLNNGHTSLLDQQTFNMFRDILMEINRADMQLWTDQLNNPKALQRYQEKTQQEEKVVASPQSPLLSSTQENVRTEIIKENKLAYIHISIFNYNAMDEDREMINPFLEEIKDYPVLIIDIRGNGGGSEFYWRENLVQRLINKPLENTVYYLYRGGVFSEPFVEARTAYGFKGLEPIHRISNQNLRNIPSEATGSFKYFDKGKYIIEPKESIGFEGKIYLLVDGKVYSSSEAFAVFTKATGFATLVGERTGGDGIGTDPLFVALPNSGFVFRFPVIMGLTSDGTCNEEFKTEPDIIVEAERASELSKDLLIRKIMEIENIEE